MADDAHTPAASVSTPATGLRPIVALDDAECRDVLSKQRLCVLAMVDGDEPYAVPVYYGFDGERMYLGVAEGRKTSVLDRNPRVCVTVSEPGARDSWRSVLVAGVARAITDVDERARAIEVMMHHNRRDDRATPAPSSTGPSSTGPSSTGPSSTGPSSTGPSSPAPAPQASPAARHGRGRMLIVERATITGRARRLPDG